MMCSVWILALLGAVHAFVMPVASFARTRPIFSASLGTPDTDKFANRFLVDQELWLQELQSEEVKKVRRELVQKYVGMGKNAQVAEREVDAFLADPKKSQPFLEMRLSALKKAYDDMGLGILVQTVAIFFFCLLATVGLQYYTAYKVFAGGCFVVSCGMHATQSWRREFSLVSFFDLAVRVPQWKRSSSLAVMIVMEYE